MSVRLSLSRAFLKFTLALVLSSVGAQECSKIRVGGSIPERNAKSQLCDLHYSGDSGAFEPYFCFLSSASDSDLSFL